MEDFVTIEPLQDARLDNQHANGLREPGYLARRPLIGLFMVLIGMGIFGVIAINLQTNGPLIQVDMRVNAYLHTLALNSSPILQDVMIFGYYMGQHVIIGIGLMLAAYFLYKRYWPELCMVVIAWAGEGAIWLTLSNYFSRPRPIFNTPVWHQMTAPGFPSGHSLSAVMCYGLIAYLLAARMPTRNGKIAVIVLAALIILYIGFSRIFIGDHYLTDVLAGYALGVAWAGLVYTSIELIAKRRR